MEIEASYCHRPAIVQVIYIRNERIFLKFRYVYRSTIIGRALVSRKKDPELYEDLCHLKVGDVVFADSVYQHDILKGQKLPEWKRFLNHLFKTSFH